MKNVYSVQVLVLVLCFTPPLSAQESTSGFREAFSAWSSSMSRSFQNIFTSPTTPTVSVPSPNVTPATLAPNVPKAVVATPNSAGDLTADVLKSKLVAKSPAEAAYIDAVVAKRDAGRISAQVVNSAYRYAMKKNRDRRVQYFKATIDAMTGGR